MLGIPRMFHVESFPISVIFSVAPNHMSVHRPNPTVVVQLQVRRDVTEC